MDICKLCSDGVERLRCVRKVFNVSTNPTRFQNRFDRSQHLLRSLTESSHDVDRERNRQDSSDSLNSQNEFVPPNHLAVRVAERHREPCTRRRNCGKPLVLEYACAWDIPCIRKNQYFLAMVEFAEILGLILLGPQHRSDELLGTFRSIYLLLRQEFVQIPSSLVFTFLLQHITRRPTPLPNLPIIHAAPPFISPI